MKVFFFDSQVYRYPENQCILGARLQLPGTLLSFNGTGEKLVAGGNDEMLHIIMIRTDTDGKSLKVSSLTRASMESQP